MKNLNNLIELCSSSSRMLHTEMVLCMLRQMDMTDSIPSGLLNFKTLTKSSAQLLTSFTKRIYKDELIESFVNTVVFKGKDIKPIEGIDWKSIPLVAKKEQGKIEIFLGSMGFYHWLHKNFTDLSELDETELFGQYPEIVINYSGLNIHKDLFRYLGIMREMNYTLRLKNDLSYAIKHDMNICKAKRSFLKSRYDESLIMPFIKSKLYGLRGKNPIYCKDDWINAPFGVIFTENDYALDLTTPDFLKWCRENIYSKTIPLKEI